MRIAYLAPEFWESPSTVGKPLARELSRYHEVRYLEPLSTRRGRFARKPGEVPHLPTPGNGIHLHCIPRASGLNDYGVVYGLYAEIRNAVDVALRDGGCDLVVTYFTLLAVSAAALARLRGRKLLLVYGDDLPNLFRPRLARWAVRPATALVARWANACVGTSAGLADDLRRYSSNVHYISNGVDLASFQRPPPVFSEQRQAGFTVGFVGGFGPWVNFDLVLDAASRLPEVHFLLVGGRDQFERVQQLAMTMPNVELTGLVPHSQVPELIGRMDVCLIPFHINRLTDRVSPIKLFEYWALGRPVICTRFQEARRVANGTLLFADTVDELVQAIDRLRRDPDLRDQLAQRGLEAVQSFDWQVLGRRFLDLIESL